MAVNPGDLLFYASSGSLFDKAISQVTGNRFIHVAIAISENEKIEMLGQGCTRNPIDLSTVAGQFVFPSPPPSAIGLQAALKELQEQVGKPYGWGDVIQAIDTSHRLFWLQFGHKDCSHLAADFLMWAGYPLSGLNDNHAQVTPGDLARFLHVQ